MEPLQALSPFCKAWIITLENLRGKKSFINEVGRNVLYHIMTIRVLFFQTHSGVATEPRLEYCCLVFSSNARNCGRQKNIIFSDVYLIRKLNLEMTWKFPPLWWLPFIKSHFSRFLGKTFFPWLNPKILVFPYPLYWTVVYFPSSLSESGNIITAAFSFVRGRWATFLSTRSLQKILSRSFFFPLL